MATAPEAAGGPVNRKKRYEERTGLSEPAVEQSSLTVKYGNIPYPISYKYSTFLI